jgi:GNAT superfamily N-acetyltransferase
VPVRFLAVGLDGAVVEADVPLLFGLAKGTFGGLPSWSDERVLEVLNTDVIFVAREDAQPAGYVVLQRVGAGVIVERLFVAPRPEQRGVGHQLLAYAEGYAITERAPVHVVEENNQPARTYRGEDELRGRRRAGVALCRIVVPSPG